MCSTKRSCSHISGLYGGEVLVLTDSVDFSRFWNFNFMKNSKDFSLNKMWKKIQINNVHHLNFDRKFVFLSVENHNKSQRSRNNHGLIRTQTYTVGARLTPEEFSSSLVRTGTQGLSWTTTQQEEYPFHSVFLGLCSLERNRWGLKKKWRVVSSSKSAN